MKGEPKRYQISTVADFLALPIEKLPECLEDFHTYAAMLNLAEAVDAALAPEVRMRVLDQPGRSNGERFVWVDDGRREADVIVHDEKGAVVEEFAMALVDR